MGNVEKPRWRDLTGAEKWEVILESQRDRVRMRDLCESFGMTRQTLHRCKAAAERAAKSALEPRSPGRKPRPESEKQTEALREELEATRNELDLMRQRYEVTKTLLSLERKLSAGDSRTGGRGGKGGRREG